MRRYIYNFVFFMLIYASSLYAENISLATSIYAGSIGGTMPQSQHSSSASPIIKKVNFKTKITTNPKLKLVLDYTREVFSQQVAEMNIDLIPIDAYVEFGQAFEFEEDELCRVEVKYIDSLGYNPMYSLLGNSYSYYLPRIFPRTIYNQSRSCSSDTCMIIWLNPTIPLYCDTTAMPVDTVLYDATTILLRALAIGCGIQSSFSPYHIPHYGIMHNNQQFVTAFDSKIHNNVIFGDTYASLEDVIIGEISDTTFLVGNSIYADGYNSSVQLYNDWELAAVDPLTAATYNTIDWQTYTVEELQNGFVDLLETEIPPTIEIRKITPYTKELLRGLGWMQTLAVGFNNPYLYFYESYLSCSGTILSPNTSYSIQISNNNVNIENITCELNSYDSSYVIGSANNSAHTFTYDTLPSKVQWERDLSTKHIVGHIKANVWISAGNEILRQEKITDIQIPYRPNSPIVNKSEYYDNEMLRLNLSALSSGSDMYKISYTGLNDLTTHTYTSTEYAIDTIIPNIPATQLYSMSIYGINNMGNSDTCTFIFGQSANPPLYMTTSVIGNTLRYDLSRNGTIDLSWVTVSSVLITDAMGHTLLNPGIVNSGAPINISSLSRGYYLLSVVANGHVYTRQFAKRS